MQFNFYVGAGIWGFLAAFLINQTARRTRINADAAIGVVTTASFAIGVILISRYRRFTQSFDAALFGNILGVTITDVIVVAAVAIVVALIVFLLYKQLLFTTFDSEVAQVYGVSTGWIETWFALLLAAAIIASIQILGVTMIAAALIIPPITARLLTDSFHRMIITSTLLGALTGLMGMYLSFYVDASSGATIVLLQAFLFTLVLIVDEPPWPRPPPGHAPVIVGRHSYSENLAVLGSTSSPVTSVTGWYKYGFLALLQRLPVLCSSKLMSRSAMTMSSPAFQVSVKMRP